MVLHATPCENVSSAVAQLKSQGLSYHYIIDRTGLSHKCVPYSAVAFHAGNSYGPHEAARGTSKQQDAHFNFVELTSVNEYSIGISLVNDNDGADPYPREQIDACIGLIKELAATLKSLKYVTTHSLVSPGRMTDPVGIDIVRISQQTGLDIWLPEQ
ncbi:MAG: N-acetylmuramoyl-L-alanine amidase [Fimbriimonas sp.]|nr:N-acetylmuramoyl-L-alanine amidase [Fimbriimonas sp.]